jgi:hypothetical protein
MDTNNENNQESKPAPGQLVVSISVNVTGRPEDAEQLAQAALKATRILCPGAAAQLQGENKTP